ncbi:MAG: hypothetical protein DMF71_10695 [Acidobacteria bacterium]|nr:MAG: hypothetical protein DMF71_10695 [Acidobacteriota bacterium]
MKGDNPKLKLRSKTILWLIPAWCLIGFAAHGQTPAPAASLTGAASNQLTPAQMLNVRTISDVRFSPDEKRVAFVVAEPVKGTTRARHIWILDVKSREVRQFTNSPKSEDTPRWSPDGKRLAFLSNRDDARNTKLNRSPGRRTGSKSPFSRPNQRRTRKIKKRRTKTMRGLWTATTGCAGSGCWIRRQVRRAR